MDFIETSVMSLTGVMDKAFDIHKKNIGTSALYLFIVFIIRMILYLILLFIGMFSIGLMAVNFYSHFRVDDITQHMDWGSIISIGFGLIILFSIIFLLEIGKQVGIIDIASKGFLDRPVRLEKALVQAFKKIPTVLSVLIAYGVIFIPIIILFGGLLLFILSNTFNIINIWSILLSLAFIVISIYLATIYMFSINTAVIEKLYFFKALKRSRLLVKKNFWRLLGINILFSLIVIAITYSIYSILGIVGGVFHIILKGMDIGEATLTSFLTIGNILRIPLQIIFSLFISPLRQIFNTILYYNQRFKKEGYDIELKLEDLQRTSEII